MLAAKSNKPKIDKFREAARELETEESEEAFDRVLTKIAKAPPKDDEFKKADRE